MFLLFSSASEGASSNDPFRNPYSLVEPFTCLTNVQELTKVKEANEGLTQTNQVLTQTNSGLKKSLEFSEEALSKIKDKNKKLYEKMQSAEKRLMEQNDIRRHRETEHESNKKERANETLRFEKEIGRLVSENEKLVEEKNKAIENLPSQQKFDEKETAPEDVLNHLQELLQGDTIKAFLNLYTKALIKEKIEIERIELNFDGSLIYLIANEARLKLRVNLKDRWAKLYPNLEEQSSSEPVELDRTFQMKDKACDMEYIEMNKLLSASNQSLFTKWKAEVLENKKFIDEIGILKGQLKNAEGMVQIYEGNLQISGMNLRCAIGGRTTAEALLDESKKEVATLSTKNEKLQNMTRDALAAQRKAEEERGRANSELMALRAALEAKDAELEALKKASTN